MADTTFIDKVTVIWASFMNDVNKAIYRAIGTGTNGVAPTTPGEVITNLGLSATTVPSGASLIGNHAAGGIASTDVQSALNELDTEKLPVVNPTFKGTLTGDSGFASDITYWGRLNRFDLNGVIGFPGGFGSTAALLTRSAPSGAGPNSVNAAVYVTTTAQPGASSFEWNQLNRLDNDSDLGENVSMYSQAYKRAAGSTWALVGEAHDTTHIQPEAALYGLELDVSANHTDVSSGGFPQRFGQIIVGYRDYGPNTAITGYIDNGSGGAGNILTVTAIAQGQVTIGQGFAGSGFSADTVITALGSGTGGVGTYIVNNSQLVASKDMTLTGCIVNAKIDNGAGAAGNTLTVTAVVLNANGSISGKLSTGMTIFCAGLSEGRTITALGTGTGGVGTYTISGAAALILPDTTTMVMNGGETNHIGNGLWIGAQFGDPGGSVFTNQIHLNGSGDTGILLDGYVQVGVACVGHYSTASIESITPSSVPIISSVGSMNNALIQFASTDPIHDGGAAGTYNSRMKILIDGNPFYIHIFNP